MARTPGEYFYRDGSLYSTHQDDRGNPSLIATLALGDDTDANGLFLAAAANYLALFEQMCEDLTLLKSSETDADEPS